LICVITRGATARSRDSCAFARVPRMLLASDSAIFLSRATHSRWCRFYLRCSWTEPDSRSVASRLQFVTSVNGATRFFPWVGIPNRRRSGFHGKVWVFEPRRALFVNQRRHMAFVIAIIADRFVHILTQHQCQTAEEFMAQIRKRVLAGKHDRGIKSAEAGRPAASSVKRVYARNRGRRRDLVKWTQHERSAADLESASRVWSLANIDGP